MSDAHDQSIDDAHAVDQHLGQAMAAFQQLTESDGESIEALERALRSLRRALIPAARLAYEAAGCPNGPGDSQALRWALAQARGLEFRRRHVQRVDEIVALSAHYALEAAMRESPPTDNPFTYRGRLASSMLSKRQS